MYFDVLFKIKNKFSLSLLNQWELICLLYHWTENTRQKNDSKVLLYKQMKYTSLKYLK